MRQNAVFRVVEIGLTRADQAARGGQYTVKGHDAGAPRHKENADDGDRLADCTTDVDGVSASH
jgi:hypothetical protein